LILAKAEIKFIVIKSIQKGGEFRETFGTCPFYLEGGQAASLAAARARSAK